MNAQVNYHDITFIPLMGKLLQTAFKLTDDEKRRHIREKRALPEGKNLAESKAIKRAFYDDLAIKYNQPWENLRNTISRADRDGFGS